MVRPSFSRAVVRSPLARAWIPGLAVAWLACTPAADPGAPTAQAPAAEAPAGEAIARIGGEAVTTAELDAWIKEDLFRQQTEGKGAAALHQLRSEALERMIDERVLEAEAAREGVAVDALLERAAQGEPPSDEEVRAFYDQNQARMGEASFEDISPRIREFLQRQSAGEAVSRYVATLRDGAGVEVDFEPPRVEVAATGPALGPDDAPVTVVEFSDFQCPFCARAGPTIKQLVARYPGQVRVVYRHFPLSSIHPDAQRAAEASACADDQGKFWEFHDAVFAAGTQSLTAEMLQGLAEQVGADRESFRQCLADGRHRAAVLGDLQDGRRAGVQGTPAFFVNGVMLSGAQNLDAFVRIIDSELERLGASDETAG